MKIMPTHQRIHICDGKHITVEPHTVKDEHPLHWHSFFEIEIILSGTGRYIVNDVSYDIVTTRVFLLTPTDFHYLQVNGEVKILNISFDETMIHERDIGALLHTNTAKAYPMKEPMYARLVGAAEMLRDECRIDGECQKQLLQYIITCLLRENGSTPPLQRDKQLEGIRRAIIYMELHFREEISLSSIATAVGYTPSYFSKLFKQATGESYVAHLTKLRLSYARSLLAGGFAVADACFGSGFSSLSGFFEVFKKNYGISPSGYKKQYKSCND